MKYLIMLFWIIFICPLKAQIIEELSVFQGFSDTLSHDKQEYHFQDKEFGISQNILFLGQLVDNDNTSYKVILSKINFSGKYVNDMIFVSKNKSYKYRVNLSSDMPFDIIENKLFFSNKNTIKGLSLITFKELFCTPFECFELISSL